MTLCRILARLEVGYIPVIFRPPWVHTHYRPARDSSNWSWSWAVGQAEDGSPFWEDGQVVARISGAAKSVTFEVSLQWHYGRTESLAFGQARYVLTAIRVPTWNKTNKERNLSSWVENCARRWLVGWFVLQHNNPFWVIQCQIRFQTIQFSISTQFQCQKQFYLKQFSLA